MLDNSFQLSNDRTESSELTKADVSNGSLVSNNDNYHRKLVNQLLQALLSIPYMEISDIALYQTNQSDKTSCTLVSMFHSSRTAGCAKFSSKAVQLCEQILQTHDSIQCVDDPDPNMVAEQETKQSIIIGKPIDSDNSLTGILIIRLKINRKYDLIKQETIRQMSDIISCVLELERKVIKENVANLILSNSSHGIMITDNTKSILWVNSAFENITGYQLHDIKGKSPKILSSGHHKPGFYAELWNQIDTYGSWQGEIYNRRNNGEVYPQYLNILALKNEEGKVLRYVGMFIDLTDAREKDDKIRQMAYYDDLTGLASRGYFIEYLGASLKNAKRRNTKVALLFMDLDNFKSVNDSLGHTVGDSYLSIIASRLSARLRTSDFVARLGGDEFCVLIEDSCSHHSIEKLVRQCQSKINEPLSLNGHTFNPRATTGIAIYPEDGETAADLLKAADIAMYEAKGNSDQFFQFYNKNTSEKYKKKLIIERDLEAAIRNNELRLHYQPKVNLKSGLVSGFEALIRWEHPELGLISPIDFIGTAEYMGLVNLLDKWTLLNACTQVIQWNESSDRQVSIAVNISPQYFEKNEFTLDVISVLADTGLAPHLLEIELTESMAKNHESHLKNCQTLIEAGVRIAIDDFGQGYSSLGILRHLPVSTLKIDKAFVDDLEIELQSVTLLTGILAMANELNLDTVIEGVETIGQLDILSDLGCETLQGYLFSKPMEPVQAFDYLLNDAEEIFKAQIHNKC